MKVGNKWKRRLCSAFLATAAFCFCLTGCTGQTASLTTQQSEVSIAQQTERLMLLCRVWGYVKYRHPAYLLGQRDWDAGLLELIPQVQAACSTSEVSDLLLTWFTGLGEIDYGRRGAGAFVPFDNQVVESDTSWTKDTAYLGEEPAAALALLPEKLPSLDRSAAPVYFDEIGTPNFSHEPEHTAAYNDPSFRLLGLFRLWNAIEYYYPYLHLAGQPWDDCLSEAIPAMLDGRDQDSYELALRTMAFQLCDPHVHFRYPDGTYSNTAEIGGYLLPTPIRAVEGKLTVTAAVEGCPLAPGDVLLSINGRTIEELASEKRQYLSLSREELLLEQAKYLITSTDTPEMELVILRDGAELTLTVQGTTHFPQEDLPPYELLEGNIGLINPAAIADPDTLHQAMAAVRDTDGLVVDLRQYPGDPASFFGILYYYLPATRRPCIITSAPEPDVPGVYTKTTLLYGYSPSYQVYLPQLYPYEQPVAILIDQQSISASEFAATILSNSDNAVLVGKPTVGTDGNVVLLPLPGGVQMGFTSLGCYELDGSQSQQVGITPDIKAPYTVQGIKEERDEPLEAALQYLASQQ